MRIRHDEVLEDHWTDLRSAIKERWPSLDDIDLDVIAGEPDRLVGMLQEYYWITKEEAEDQIAAFEEEVLRGEQRTVRA
jgi:uncharacterized protein YjbJ (UPF0337 family)